MKERIWREQQTHRQLVYPEILKKKKMDKKKPVLVILVIIIVQFAPIIL